MKTTINETTDKTYHKIKTPNKTYISQATHMLPFTAGRGACGMQLHGATGAM